MKNWIVILTACLICSELRAASIRLFQDTFDAADSQNINEDYTARQSGGKISAVYTGDLSSVAIGSGTFVQEGLGEVELGVNLADFIADGDFELSFRMSVNDALNKYAAFYLESANETTRGSSRFGFHIWGPRDDSTVLFTVYGGTSSVSTRSFTQAAVNAVWQNHFGFDFDRTDEHVYQLVSTDGGATNRYDFIVDGVTLVTMDYAFSEDTVRVLNFYTSALAALGGGGTLDDLTIMVPDPAIGLMVSLQGYKTADVSMMTYNLAYYYNLSDPAYGYPSGSNIWETQDVTLYDINYRASRLTSLVADSTPDIMCFQEVNAYWWGYLITNADSVINTEFHDGDSNMVTYFWVGNMSALGGSDGTADNAASSVAKNEFYNLLFFNTQRFKLLTNGYFNLGTDLDTNSSNLRRICTWAELQELGSGVVAVYASTHLITPSGSLYVQENRDQAVLVCNQLSEIAGDLPVIWGGDCNMAQDRITTTAASYFAILAQGYHDARADADFADCTGTARCFGTSHSDWVNEYPIDHIFYKNAHINKYQVRYECFDKDTSDVCTNKSMVGTSQYYDLSDHLGVYVEAVIKNMPGVGR